jgi:hypothetical protein
MYTKKYQVFVSSTFNDLKEERNALMLRLLLDGFIPAGMELFGAIDEDQFEHIKRIIDLSDYYVVIVGNRYGTTDAKGMSYTEKEYLYAGEKKIPVLALIHSDPGSLQAKHAEKPALAKKLERFRKSLRTGRLVTDWQDTASLIQNALSSLHKEKSLFAGVGWVRGNAQTSVETLTEMNELRKKVAELEQKVATAEAIPLPEDIAHVDELYTVAGTWGQMAMRWSVSASWAEICITVVGLLPVAHWEETVRTNLAKAFYLRSLGASESLAPTAKLDDAIFNAMRTQMSAYRLVAISKQTANVPSGYTGLVWSTTAAGQQVNFNATVVRTSKVPALKGS